MKVKYFDSEARFRAWLQRRHVDTRELWVGFYRKNPGRKSIRYAYTGAALAVLMTSACAHSRTTAAAESDCEAAATVGARSECTLAEAQALQARLDEEERAMLLALESYEAQRAADTGTGRSLAEEFRRSQLAWREYRDAECSYAYASAFGSSIRGLTAATCLRELLVQRIERVRAARLTLDAQQPSDARAQP